MASQRRRLHPAVLAAALPGAAVGLLTALPLTPVQAQTVGADLKVVSPTSGATLGDKAFSLDVAFHSRSSAPVVSTELWVDGVRWVHRDLDTPQIKNVLSFAIDSSSLGSGTHTFLVRVLTANGGSGETTLQAIAGGDGGTVETGPNAPEMRFQTPVNGKRVMGNVELLLDSPAKNGLNPYVTIYVDKQFKTLKNFPPYTYEWDTTTVPNGLHTIEATSYLGSSQQSTSKTIKVFVDNPGGNTALKSDIPDLSAPAKTPVNTAKTVAIALPSKPAHAVSARIMAPVALVPVGEPVLSAAHVSTPLSATSAGLVSALPEAAPSAHALLSLQAPSTTVPKVAALHPARTTHAIPALAVRSSHAAIIEAPATATVAHPAVATAATAAVAAPILVESAHSLAANDVAVAAPQMSAISPTVAIRPTGPAAMGALIAPHFLTHTSHTANAAAAVVLTPAMNAAANHGALSMTPHSEGMTRIAGISHINGDAITPMTSPATAILASPVATAHAITGSANAHGAKHHLFARQAVTTSHAGMRIVSRPAHHGILQSSEYRPIAVAFNGQRIAFDVQPRVEAGLPIAPFRQIFEHTGGQVDWVEKTQVVHAVNATKEIVITVGKSDATVNGQNVSMARPAFTEHGRTIVPLSFVGKALDVNVKYDSATGRLQITSK